MRKTANFIILIVEYILGPGAWEFPGRSRWTRLKLLLEEIWNFLAIGTGPALLLGLLSVSVPILFEINIDQEIDGAKGALAGIGLMLLFMGAAVLASVRWTQRFADAKYYVNIKTSLSGPEQLLYLAARHIERLCERYLKASDSLQKIRIDFYKGANSAPEDIGEYIASREFEIRQGIRHFRRSVSRSSREIERVRLLKRALSEAFGVDVRRICDHIVQYSPGLHLVSLERYLVCWERLLENSTGNHSDVDEEMFNRVNKIYSDFSFRRKVQRKLLSNWQLLGTLKTISAEYSASEALLNYARAIAFVSSLNPSERNEADAEEREKHFIEQVRFLLRKQRVHGNFDVNLLLIHLAKYVCDVLENPIVGPQEQRALKGAQDLLESLSTREKVGYKRSTSTVEWRHLPKAYAKEDLAIFEATKGKFSDLGQMISQLRHLPQAVDAATHRFRGQIFQELGKFWGGLVLSAENDHCDLVIVIHGYSSNLRSAIREMLQQNPNYYERTRIFILKTRYSGAKQRLKDLLPDLLIHELKQGRSELRIPANVRGFASITAGDLESLKAVVGERAKIIVLSGCVCYDKTQVLLPRELTSTLERMVEAITVEHIRFVAEPSKRLSSIDSDEYFHDHVDNLAPFSLVARPQVNYDVGVICGEAAQ